MTLELNAVEIANELLILIFCIAGVMILNIQLIFRQKQEKHGRIKYFYGYYQDMIWGGINLTLFLALGVGLFVSLIYRTYEIMFGQSMVGLALDILLDNTFSHFTLIIGLTVITWMLVILFQFLTEIILPCAGRIRELFWVKKIYQRTLANDIVRTIYIAPKLKNKLEQYIEEPHEYIAWLYGFKFLDRLVLIDAGEFYSQEEFREVAMSDEELTHSAALITKFHQKVQKVRFVRILFHSHPKLRYEFINMLELGEQIELLLDMAFEEQDTAQHINEHFSAFQNPLSPQDKKVINEYSNYGIGILLWGINYAKEEHSAFRLNYDMIGFKCDSSDKAIPVPLESVEADEEIRSFFNKSYFKLAIIAIQSNLRLAT